MQKIKKTYSVDPEENVSWMGRQIYGQITELIL